MNIKSKKNKHGWKSMIIDDENKIKVVGNNCRLKSESRTQAHIAYEIALKSKFGDDQ